MPWWRTWLLDESWSQKILWKWRFKMKYSLAVRWLIYVMLGAGKNSRRNIWKTEICSSIRRYYLKIFFNNLIFKSWTNIIYYLYLDFDINRISKIVFFVLYYYYNLLFLQHCLIKEIFKKFWKFVSIHVNIF